MIVNRAYQGVAGGSFVLDFGDRTRKALAVTVSQRGNPIEDWVAQTMHRGCPNPISRRKQVQISPWVTPASAASTTFS